MKAFVAEEELVAAVAGEGDFDMLTCCFGNPVGGEDGGVGKGLAELVDEIDEVFGCVGLIDIEGGVIGA